MQIKMKFPPNLLFSRRSMLLKRGLSSSPSQKPQPSKINTDMIGPSDPVSNLRPIVYKQNINETNVEKRFREQKMEVQQWNQEFWHGHNSRFLQEREEYLKKNLPEGKQTLSADEMSVFYKSFLDKNWRAHFEYNFLWYKKNFNLLGLAIRINLMKIFKSSSITICKAE